MDDALFNKKRSPQLKKKLKTKILVCSSSLLFFQTISLKLILLPLVALSCGVNQMKNKAPASPVEEAQLLLEKGDYLGAREKLSNHLENKPEDYKATALLASTFAAEAGISILDLFERSLNAAGEDQKDIIEELVPAATEVNIALIRTARNLIAPIPADAKEADIAFGETIYVSVYTLMLVKKLSIKEEPPTLEDALEMIESLDSAIELAEKNNIPTAKAEEVKSAIAAEPGATEQEKLKSYLDKVKAKNSAQ